MNGSATILLLLKRVDCVDGVAAYLETILDGLRSRGDRVVIVSGPVTTPDGSETRRRAIEAAALEWIVIDPFSASRPKPALVRKILGVIRRHGVDVVSPQGFAVLPLGVLVGRLSGRPVVANYHPSLHGDQTASMTGERSVKERLSMRAVTTAFRADRFIALSHEIHAFFRDVCRIPERLIHEQVLGVETEFYRPPSTAEREAARARFGIGRDGVVGVLPGRMNLSKGHDLVAAAVRQLRGVRPDLRLTCLFPGGGNQRAEIEDVVLRDTQDREQFRFLGFVDRQTLRDTYWAADIVLLPSRMEGFGLVVAEAMCCGAVAVRTPSGGWQDQVVENVTGYVVPFNDAPALARAIASVADQPDRETMREAAIKHASTKFDKTRMVVGTSDLYRAVAALRNPARRRRTPRPRPA